jgi:hypothetical protein
MIDTQYSVRRFIAEYSEETEELLAEYELSSFELIEFQAEFNETNPRDPMFDCYSIKKENVEFIKSHIVQEPEWDFVNKSYFVEAHII